MATSPLLRSILLAVITGALAACLPPAADGSGTVVRVLDGDSLVVETARGERLEVRLAGIDAPEKDQPHSETARGALSDMALGETVNMDVLEIDQYGRSVARVYRAHDDLSLNRTLVSRGHAWVYRRHAKDAALVGLENQAKRERRGLWALPAEDIVPPWQWRRTHSTVHRR